MGDGVGQASCGAIDAVGITEFRHRRNDVIPPDATQFRRQSATPILLTPQNSGAEEAAPMPLAPHTFRRQRNDANPLGATQC